MSSNPPASDSPGDEALASTAEAPSEHTFAADELLPPVEPPDASFILQLFVVPAFIVLMVVLLGWVVTSLANQGERDPVEIVATLRSSSQNRWQQAFELANALRAEQQHPDLKDNTQLAEELAKLLTEEVEAGHTDNGSVKLRSFLCAALGAFHVDAGVPALLQAARDDADDYVRGSAINALAVLADDFRNQQPPRSLVHEELVDTLIDLGNDSSDAVRSQTAYALGVITLDENADPRLTVELETLVGDLYPRARFNAALALARRGSLLAVQPLAEMLDLEYLVDVVQDEEVPVLQARTRNTILKNALDAAQVVVKDNPSADLSVLRTAVEKLVADAPGWDQQGGIPEQLINRAQEVLDSLAR